MKQELQAYEIGGRTFQLRPDTSDIKGIDEVMKGGYRRSRPFAFDVEPGEVWIDLGAMVGAFSAYAEMKGAARVIAVEPDPDHVRILQLNAPKAEIKAGAVVIDEGVSHVTLNRNDKRGNTWRNSIMRKWQGGSTIEVAAIRLETLLAAAGDNVCIKMDIEGMEMPVLEYLLQHPESLAKVKKLVFEWSFDVDGDLARYRNVMSGLAAAFANVAPLKEYAGYDTWPKSWFPACTTIFCMR